MNAAFAPVRSVSSTAQVLVLGQFVGKVSGRTMDDQDVCVCMLSMLPLLRQ